VAQPAQKFWGAKMDYFRRIVQGVSQLLKQSDWAQIQDFKLYHNDDYIY